ncbi:ArsR/SmtB family transcription factor [Kutzneria albida]|uniref:HTH arsR-type domain-containing protein n=1 Tax=Kutzneria albida DSM 43870 TaxID=1449976 RepID=W5WHC3_9PSEU|nr:helix-turn-helix domain-containing protein [Kutzneria albida]AHI00007.1 hypothetical protein KALB_6647 [Kutzneria albida DSM 43870]
MGWWQVNADTLAGSRFVVSPLAEATASLITLARATAAHPGERAWLDAHLPAYRELLAADPITASLVRAGLRRRWIADFFTPTPTGEPAEFERELAGIRSTPAEIARENLGPALTPELDRTDLAQRTADLLEWVWTRAVLPEWPRRRRVIEADVVARTGKLGQGGWAAVLGDLRQGMRWLGSNRLQVNVYDYPPREVDGAQLFFVPVTPRQGWVCWDAHNRSAVVYPCSGVLAEPPPPVPDTLGRLLGAARAGVLVLLDTPKSTTQLVALTGQGLGSVGRHLKVLLDARLVCRQRAGRSVLYRRTLEGEALVAAQFRE